MRALADIRTLPSDDPLGWEPVRQHRQSDYVVGGPCYRCGDWIACGEVHETRYWKGGLSEQCQHIECPEVEPCDECSGSRWPRERHEASCSLASENFSVPA